jgi:hypothetical protein
MDSEFEKAYMAPHFKISPEEVIDDFEEIAIADVLFGWESNGEEWNSKWFCISAMDPYWLRNVLSKVKSW